MRALWLWTDGIPVDGEPLGEQPGHDPLDWPSPAVADGAPLTFHEYGVLEQRYPTAPGREYVQFGWVFHESFPG